MEPIIQTFMKWFKTIPGMLYPLHFFLKKPIKKKKILIEKKFFYQSMDMKSRRSLEKQLYFRGVQWFCLNLSQKKKKLTFILVYTKRQKSSSSKNTWHSQQSENSKIKPLVASSYSLFKLKPTSTLIRRETAGVGSFLYRIVGIIIRE